MDELREIEESLRHALRHVPAPEGFTERVLARVAAQPRLSVMPAMVPGQATGSLLHLQPAAWWVAAAAALLLAVGGGNLLHVRYQHEVQREQVAEREVDLAMQLTSHALNEVEVNLDRSGAGRFTHLLNEAQ